MKFAAYFISVLLLSIMIFSCGEEKIPEGTFSFSPEKPKQNEEIKIYFNKENTKLADAENIDLTVYYFGKNLDKVELIPMNSDDKILTAKVTPSDSTLGLLFNFTDWEMVENNEEKGFFVQLYDKEGDLLPGADAGLANAYATWGSWYARLERNQEKAVGLFNKEFEKNPEVKSDFFNDYFTTLKRERPEIADSIIKIGLAEIEEKGNFTKDDYETLASWYRVYDPVKAMEYKTVFQKKYPQNEFFQNEKLNEIYSEKNIENKLRMLGEYEAVFPANENLTSAYDITANYYRDNNEFDKALEFLKDNNDKVSLYRFYATGLKVLDENGDAKIAGQIAELGVERGRKELESPDPEKKPFFLSNKGWKFQTENYLAANLLILGKAEQELGNKEEALKSFEESYQLSKGEDPDANEAYTGLLFEIEKYEKAAEVLEKAIEEGSATSGMKETLKKVYIAKNGSEENFDEYLSKFESTANKKLNEELQKKMINEPAPEFTLVDLNGEEVSLADYKGKTIVLDFWATWCGPCLQSFPAMKTAVENYDDKNVKFLFVNTWERVEDKKTNAQNFIKENNYPFHVLMDEENRVITDYKVTGIPTKFIIDGGGNIRFRSVGYGGNPDQLIEEIDAMIELVN